ncbi:MAG: DUF2189 domain-containing protein [Acidocella sp.]|nr:DUF2189 domain-containing protein [Acidocella sp.]
MPIRNPVEWMVAQLEAGAALGTDTASEYWPGKHAAQLPKVRQISTNDIKAALTAGLRDFADARTDVIFLCLIYPVMGLVLAGVAAKESLLPMLFPVASGFALVGPLVALGLYEMSRQREVTGRMNWLDVFKVLRSPAIWSIMAMGVVLIGLFLLWLAVAQTIYDLTLGPLPPASVPGFISAVFTTNAGWAMIGLGLAAGALFAIGVLAISVVSFPLLLDRPTSFITAITVSLLAMRRNPLPLLLWGLVVAVALFLGSLPFFLGLVVVLPVLGHATWHLYRRLVVA